MDYRKTVYLPQTSFPMKAQLPELEPRILERWQKENLYAKIQAKRKDCPQFLLHDGPPYSNGHLHLGHALNKILKDAVIKYHNLLGYKAPYVPGWDCHGLPIEWKVEEEFRKKGINKNQITSFEFRNACRDFAQKWVDIQAEEFQRLGVLGDWQKPYLTMNRSAEADISKELLLFLMKGSLYKGVKPVFWSVVEQTALAEAEVEYKDKVSPSIYVAFPIVETDQDILKEAAAVIWTTTPWTLPGNRAICFSPEATYELIEISGPSDSPHLKKRFLVAQELRDAFLQQLGVQGNVIKDILGAKLSHTICHHPWHSKGYDFNVPLLPGSHVTMEQGTGLVHTAPGHGVDDFQVALTHKIDIVQPVGDDGYFYEHVPLWGGKHVYKVNDEIIEDLQQSGHLLQCTSLTHSYPHSWRSKAPLIYRTTPQWFISMEINNLREKALEAMDGVRWLPPQSFNRLYAMVKNRPDWCLSRQRVWGIPLAIFVHKKTGEPLKDEKINDRILKAIAVEGCDLWFQDGVEERFLTPDYNPHDYEKCRDIIDVWFESGCSHSYVIENDDRFSGPVDLYLEGSDQHRGWFQSSLLECVGTRGVAPFKTVLTHGFMVDQDGYKMSKSVGNTINLTDILKSHGADILRLLLIGSDYVEDSKIGKDILKANEDIYRRLRNTLRFLLGNLPEKSPATVLPYETLPNLEKWVLHRLFSLSETIRGRLKEYDLHNIFKDIYNFCTLELSAFYFDIRKDTLYCADRQSLEYKGTCFVLEKLFEYISIWLSPILSFTTEEAWQIRHPSSSVHEQDFPMPPAIWQRDDLREQMDALLKIRAITTGALEKARADKKIGSSLQAKLNLYVDSQKEPLPYLTNFDLPQIMITSDVEIHHTAAPPFAEIVPNLPSISLNIVPATGQKCERCWRVLPEVEKTPHLLCERCENVVATFPEGVA